ncbi:hypothetical protein FG385_31935 [Amycolatopsis alkalitolerans]|uniref:Uncharacterized protein n=1 Tax=Amycolatopsis alkalitolerans TaxID=2547244 RepID=A0A5C4LRE3_9PSEU|nr:hypothetical protein [Amycolatopsis alkalitolerans]TNC19828.1 hypothetical protein FG385_31935 [Amycolatopsis alkalitolerans]
MAPQLFARQIEYGVWRIEFSCCADSVRSVGLMTAALRATGRPLDVLVELCGTAAAPEARDEATAIQVAAELAVLRSGACLTHDDGFAAGSHRCATGSTGLARVGAGDFEAHRRSRLPTIGKRDASFDEGPPEPQLFRRDRVTGRLTGHTVTAMNDQHSFPRCPRIRPFGSVTGWVFDK